MHIHYCMNRLVGSSLWGKSPAFCTNCGMSKDKSQGCCKDECKQINLQADQQLTSTGFTLRDFSIQAIVPSVVFNTTAKICAASIVHPVGHAPPGLQSRKLYLQNRALLI